MDREALDREYQQRLHAIGLPAEDVLQLMARVRQVDAALDAWCCPECSTEIVPRERLEPAGPGAAWYGYQCVCGFLGTRIEAEN